MGGIVFVRTMNLELVRKFYQDLGMEIWLSQPNIEIMKFDNMLLGFHQQDVADTDSLITFFYDSKEEVDEKYRQFQTIATSEPMENSTYRIYNFFANDPEGRKIEFQMFLHELEPI